MTVIAMTREMGSLGRDVAQGVAQQLGLSVVYHELVESLAEKMHLKTSTVTRYLEGKSGLLERFAIRENDLLLYTAEEIFDLAVKGNVLIRGWGATYLLRPVPHVLCVRVCAPLEVRVKRIVERLDTMDAESARAEILASDAHHARIMERLFGVTDWEDPKLYDLVLDTGRDSVDDCVERVIAATKQPEFRETPASRAILANLALAAHVRAALHSRPDTARINPDVDADNGKITLSGIVGDDVDVKALERVVASLPGVTSVESRLRRMSEARNYISE